MDVTAGGGSRGHGGVCIQEERGGAYPLKHIHKLAWHVAIIHQGSHVTWGVSHDSALYPCMAFQVDYVYMNKFTRSGQMRVNNISYHGHTMRKGVFLSELPSISASSGPA